MKRNGSIVHLNKLLDSAPVETDRDPEKGSGQAGSTPTNNLKKTREQLLMSKAELARKAGVSPLTIDRIEKGKNCRMETKRKIILALGFTLDKKDLVFPE